MIEKSQPEEGQAHAPQPPSFRKQAIVTVKVLLIMGGTMGALVLLEGMIAR